MSLFEKLKKYHTNNPKKLFEALMTVSVISLVSMGAVVDSGMKEITVLRTDLFENVSESFTSKTRQDNVYAFFKEKGITVADDEILGFAMTDTLTDGETLEIKQGKSVTITVDGITKTILTSQTNVANALFEAGVNIGANDWADPSFEAPITENMQIILHRITVAEETVTETFSGPVENRTDDTMYEDEKNIINGSDGEKQVVYRVMYNGDNEAYREIISETVIKEATPTIITVGTKKRPVVPTISRGGKNYTYSRKLTVEATAYDTSPAENGGYTKTAMGLTPGFGIVAVDPNVIPLGTRLYIESSDGGQSWTYGYCIAGDTGGAIKGNRIDLCYTTRAECIQFGRRSATVYVLD